MELVAALPPCSINGWTWGIRSQNDSWAQHCCSSPLPGGWIKFHRPWYVTSRTLTLNLNTCVILHIIWSLTMKTPFFKVKFISAKIQSGCCLWTNWTVTMWLNSTEEEEFMPYTESHHQRAEQKLRKCRVFLQFSLTSMCIYKRKYYLVKCKTAKPETLCVKRKSMLSQKESAILYHIFKLGLQAI